MTQGNGAHFAAAAERLLDTPFRLHGRNPQFGIDCVGLVYCALEALGRRPIDLPQYRLRNTSIEAMLRIAPANQFQPAAGSWRAGDLLLLIPGPAQHHLAILAGDHRSLIHAHAGLGRVVRSPTSPNWPTLRRWRLVPNDLEQ